MNHHSSPFSCSADAEPEVEVDEVVADEVVVAAAAMRAASSASRRASVVLVVVILVCKYCVVLLVIACSLLPRYHGQRVRVCVCVCVERERERKKGEEGGDDVHGASSASQGASLPLSPCTYK